MESNIEVEYYENKDEFGLRFPAGIEAGELLKIIRRNQNLRD